MALTTLQVELAGTGKGRAPGKHPDADNLYLEVTSATSKSFTGRHTLEGEEIWRGCGPAKHSLKRAIVNYRRSWHACEHGPAPAPGRWNLRF
jgi:hypothetical protein